MNAAAKRLMSIIRALAIFQFCQVSICIGR